MTKEELIKRLEDNKANLFKELSFINGKHEAIMREIAEINDILTKAYAED